MEQLQTLVYIVGITVVGCVIFTIWNGISWFISLIGGVCIGCGG